MPRTPQEYKELRNEYDPRKIGSPINFIFLAESPPESGDFFYDPMCLTKEFLFRALMDLVEFKIDEEFTPVIKKEGLYKFQVSGCFLIDSIYTPIDKLRPNDTIRAIKNNYPNLKREVETYLSTNTKIILIKATVYDSLFSSLTADEFPVINRHVKVPFPSNGHQNCFSNSLELIKIHNQIDSFSS